MREGKAVLPTLHFSQGCPCVSLIGSNYTRSGQILDSLRGVWIAQSPWPCKGTDLTGQGFERRRPH